MGLTGTLVLRACAALYALLLAGCASLGPLAATIDAPGEIAFRGTLVGASAPGDGSLVIGVRNDSGNAKDIAVRCMPAVIGKVKVVSREVTGYHQETQCSDTTCWVIDVPDYREVETEKAVPGIFSATPAWVRVEPGQAAAMSVRFQNSSDMSEAFSLYIRLTVSDHEGRSDLLITCRSTLLLGKE